jgi:hypothetical protein
MEKPQDHRAGPALRTIGAPAQKFHQAQISQYLKLLADFVADVLVVRMKARQRRLVR